MTAAERIRGALEGKKENSIVCVSAPDVVAVSKLAKQLDGVAKELAEGAARVIAEYRTLRPDILDGDPRLDVFQMAGQLKGLLEAAGV